MFFFFKQKTAYEMRISDWSSDVCSSDLWGRGTVDSWALSTVEDRAKVWDGIIEMIEDGTIAKGHYANFHYDQFMSGTMESVRNIYRTLDLVLSPDVEAKMMAYLGEKDRKSTRLNSSH